MKVKADLHQYLLIGFHDFWIEKQIGDLEKNLLKIMIEGCSKKGINVCSITSQYEKDQNDKTKEQIDNPDFGLIHDRFSYLANEAERIKDKYDIEVDKENQILIKVVNKQTKERLIILNSQIVGAEINEKRVDTLVIGGNRVPNNMNIEETLKYADKKGFINLTKNIGDSRSFPLGEEGVKEYGDYYDAFGWDAQKMIPNRVGKIPFIGKKFGNALKLNKDDLELYRKFEKFIVPFSGAHNPFSIGDASIEFCEANLFNKLFYEPAKEILSSLKDKVQLGMFNPKFGYTSISNLLKVSSIFSKGARIYSEQGEKNLGNRNLYSKGFLN